MSTSGAGFPPPPPPPPSNTPSTTVEPSNPKWLTDPKGLDLNHLKHAGNFPSDLTLLDKLQVDHAKAGKKIDSDESQTKVEAALKEEICAFIKTLWNIDKTTPKFTKQIWEDLKESGKKKKARNFRSGANGLYDAYEYLHKEVTAISKQVDLAQREELLAQDPAYQQQQLIARPLLANLNQLIKQYDTLDDQAQQQIYEKIKAVVSEIEQEKSKIHVFTNPLAIAREKLKKAEDVIKSRVSALEKVVSELEEGIKPFLNEPGYEAEVEKRQAALSAARENLEQNKHPTHKETQDLEAATLAVKTHEENQKRTELLQGLFALPVSWEAINKVETQKATKVKKADSNSAITGAIDTTGMESPNPKSRHFDVRFLSLEQRKHIAFFIARDEKELEEYKNSIGSLAEAINGILAVNHALNFNTLMDIAEHRIYRKKAVNGSFQFAPIAKQLLNPDLIEINEKIIPNYVNLLARSQNFKNEEYNKARGIVISQPAKKSQYTKYYEYTRTINFDYLDKTQLENLGKFFLDNSNVKKESINIRVNEVLNNTNLSFEEFIEIAFGYRKRKGDLSKDDHKLLANGQIMPFPQNLYNDAIKQRQTYLEAKLGDDLGKGAGSEESLVEVVEKLEAVKEELVAEKQEAQEQPPISVPILHAYRAATVLVIDPTIKLFNEELNEAEKILDPDPNFKPQQTFMQKLGDNDYSALCSIGEAFAYRASRLSKMVSRLDAINQFYTGADTLEILGEKFYQNELADKKTQIQACIEKYIELCQNEIKDEKSAMPGFLKRVALTKVENLDRRKTEIARFDQMLAQRFESVETKIIAVEALITEQKVQKERVAIGM